MYELIKITDQLTSLFMSHKDEVLIASLLLNLAMLCALVSGQVSRTQTQKQQDKAKAAIYNPKPFRKD